MVSAQVQMETRIRRRVIKTYILADPVTIVFTRFPRIPDGAGGWVKDSPITLPPQVMRLVPYKRRLTSLTVHTADGDIPDVQYSLVAMPGVDCERWDEFQMNGAWYKVTGKEPKTELPATNDRVTILIEIRDKDK